MPPQSIAHIWPLVKDQIALALKRGNVGTSIDGVERDLANELAQLWLCSDGVAITQLTRHSGELRCILVAFTGNFTNCGRYLSDLEQFGRNEGCVSFVILGRKGWRRRLRGYKEPYIILEKAL